MGRFEEAAVFPVQRTADSRMSIAWTVSDKKVASIIIILVK
jgi:hypothetical protein